jgi:hypothetical protein
MATRLATTRSFSVPHIEKEAHGFHVLVCDQAGGVDVLRRLGVLGEQCDALLKAVTRQTRPRLLPESLRTRGASSEGTPNTDNSDCSGYGLNSTDATFDQTIWFSPPGDYWRRKRAVRACAGIRGAGGTTLPWPQHSVRLAPTPGRKADYAYGASRVALLPISKRHNIAALERGQAKARLIGRLPP